jgi:hypothetical protein
MATRPGIDANLITRLGADHQALFFAVKAEFDTDTIRVWTGAEDLTINSETYLGAGQLLTFGTVDEGTDLASTGLTIGLTGMDATILNLGLTEQYQNRPITFFLGYLSGETNNVAGTITLFKGRMTAMMINDDPVGGSTITVSAENRLVDLKRPSNLRYSKASQQYIDETDTGFNRVLSIQDMEINWGRPGSSFSADDPGDFTDFLPIIF